MSNREKLESLRPLPESRGKTTSVYTEIHDGKVVTIYNCIADTIATITFTIDEENDKMYKMTLKEGRRKPVEGLLSTNGRSSIISTENDTVVVFSRTGNVYFVCSDVLSLFEEVEDK